MAATQLGTINQKAPGASTEVDANSITHTVIKTMTRAMAETPSNHPVLGSSTNALDAVVYLQSYSISYEPGDVAVVNYRYVGNAGGNTNDPNNGQGGAIISPVESYELDVSLEQQSILRWAAIKYQGSIGIEELAILRKMIQVGLQDDDGTYFSDQLTTADALIVANLIEQGTTSFLAPAYVWRRRRASASWNPSDKIGRISTPAGPYPNIEGVNWLYMGATATGTGGTADQLTDTWQSSPYGDTWDQYIYGNAR